MDVSAYFESLSQEFKAVQNRVRYLINRSHEDTHGHWNESILRSVLRRHLPGNNEVSRGFIVAPDGNTKEIDILIRDTTFPVLFQDGELVIVTTDAVRAIIEVKAKLRRSDENKVLDKLVENAEFLHNNATDETITSSPPFIGLFSYEWDGNCNSVDNFLGKLQEKANSNDSRVINHVSLGESFFIRFWRRSPHQTRGYNYKNWHAYELNNRSFGYFIHNLVDAVSGDSVEKNQELWFPYPSKEVHRISTKPLLPNNG